MKQLTEQVKLRTGVVLKNYYDGTVTGDEIAYYGMRTGGAGLFIIQSSHR